MAQCLYIRIWRNTDSHRIRYQTWRCLWNLIWFWFTHSFTIKLKHGANIREIYDIAKEFLVFNTSEVPQIWLSLRPPIFNSRMNTDFFAAWAAWNLKGSRRFRRWRRFSWPIRSDLRRFFDSPAPLCEEGLLIPLPSPRPYHKGKGCSWRRYSSARVLVSQRSLCSKGLAGMLNQYSIFLSRPGPSSRRGFLTPSLLASSLPSLSCPQ